MAVRLNAATHYFSPTHGKQNQHSHLSSKAAAIAGANGVCSRKRASIERSQKRCHQFKDSDGN